MARLTEKDGFKLCGWMVTDLHLAGGELIAYALVHQFAASKTGVYNGGIPYLCEWTGWSVDTASRMLSKLAKKGLIIPERRSGKTTIYRLPTPRKMRQHPPQNADTTPRKNTVVPPAKSGTEYNKEVNLESKGNISAWSARILNRQ